MTRLGLILMLALGVACGDDDGRMVDGGAGTPDGGGITFDAGPADTGLQLVDAGGTVDGGGTVDAGTTTDAGPTPACATTPPPTLTGDQVPRCAAATLTCAQACDSQACFTACLADDATPPLTFMGQMITCETCLNVQFTGCAATNGCQAEWGELQCCAEACADQACVMGCQTMFGPAFQTCAMGVGASCPITTPSLQLCFAAE